MPGRIIGYLRRLLARGAFRIGQIRVASDLSLCHADDTDRPGLREFHDPHDAIEIARHDDEGRYRPLKTAPDLRHGWRLVLRNENEVLLALDFLYPAALGTAELAERRALAPVDLRQTLSRQTGMYAVTKNLTGAQANALVGGFCHAGCLRRILWRISPEDAPPSPMDVPAPPLLCAEACHLFVARAREVLKGKAG